MRNIESWDSTLMQRFEVHFYSQCDLYSCLKNFYCIETRIVQIEGTYNNGQK